MDTSKFEITLDHKEFYNSYINTIRKLYSDSFIQKNNIMPDSERSLVKTISSAIGKNVENYDVACFEEIIKKTNERYKKIEGSDIVHNVKDKMLRNITIFSDIISSIMKEIGLYDLSEKFVCSSKKLLENSTETDLDEHVNDNVKNTESGIEELNGILEQISDSDNESIVSTETVTVNDKDIVEEDDTHIHIPTIRDKVHNHLNNVADDIINDLIKVITKNDDIDQKMRQKIVTLEAENATLKKQLDKAMEEVASIPTDPEKRIELIKELIASHENKTELKEILVSLVVSL